MLEQGEDECERREQLQHIRKPDPDPRVRRRAHAVLLVGEGHPQASVARWFHTSADRVHVWQERFMSAGRDGLADRSRGGRPPKLTAADRAFVEEALDCGPGRRRMGCPPGSGRYATSKRCCSGRAAST